MGKTISGLILIWLLVFIITSAVLSACKIFGII